MNNLKKLRTENKKRVVELAATLGISRKHYYDLEKGERRLNADHIKKFAEIYNCSADQILGGYSLPEENLYLAMSYVPDYFNSLQESAIEALTHIKTNFSKELIVNALVNKYSMAETDAIEIVDSIDNFKNLDPETQSRMFNCLLNVMSDLSKPTPIQVVCEGSAPYTPSQRKLPVIGTVTAGPNGLAYSELMGEEQVDEDDINNEAKYYLLQVKGDSMIGEGIVQGDLALVRDQPDVESGDLAVVIVDGEEGTLKRVYKKENSIVLQSANAAYPPRIFAGKELELVRIAGKVKVTKRKY